MIFMYHNVAEKPGFCTVAMDQFRRQIDWLRSKKNIVNFSEYVAQLSEKGNTDGIATITFDDGFKSFAEFAVPHLVSLGIPAIVFIPSGLAGRTNEWDSHLTKEVIPIMNWDEIRSVISQPGISAGTHGTTHVSLGWLNKTTAGNEVRTARMLAEEKLERTVTFFAYPYGQVMDIPPQGAELLASAGYNAACSTRFGRDNFASDLYALKRIPIEPEHTLEDVIAMCSRRLHPRSYRQFAKELLWRLGLRGGPAGRKPQ